MENDNFLENAELFASDHRGIYIPQFFAQAVFREAVQGVSDEQYAVLEAGPDHEHYWDVWDEVLGAAVINHPVLGACTLWQDGDLWVVPAGQE